MKKLDKTNKADNYKGEEFYDFDFRKMRFMGRNPGKETSRLLIRYMIFFVVVVLCVLVVAIHANASNETISLSVVGSALILFFMRRAFTKKKTPS